MAQPSIGRPIPKAEDDSYSGVGPTVFDYDSTRGLIPQRPFDTSKDWYEASVNQREKLMKTGETSTTTPDNALVNGYLRNAIRIIDPKYDSGPFFLLSPDSRDCNHLIDDTFTITGVIDRETAIFVLERSAFKARIS